MSKTYLTIMTKNGVFSFLGLVEAISLDEEANEATVTAIVKQDPRESEPLVRQFPKRNDAIESYEQAIRVSVDRGWEVVYRGQPLHE